MRSSSSSLKRARTNDSLPRSPPLSSTSSSSHAATTTSSFRNVSACNRCRIRKNRCDQKLPACSSCDKAGVKCVGFDPVTKREIPRTYVYYLENRVSYLESLLADNGVSFAPSQDFDLGGRPSLDQLQSHSTSYPTGTGSLESFGGETTSSDAASQSHESRRKGNDDERKLNSLVSNIGMVSVQATSDPRYLGSTSGISFARVVVAAIKSSVSPGSVKTTSQGPSKPAVATSKSSVRESFFGLQSKPAVEPAPFPDRDLGLRLVTLYFDHANPQIPILHRGEFMALFDRAYASMDQRRSARELYMLNIVFAIGAGTILEDSRSSHLSSSSYSDPLSQESRNRRRDKHSSPTEQSQPEEYHASAMTHFESFLGSMSNVDEPSNFVGGLEELQAVLLLAGFALLRPQPPGLWYISGVATRLGVDLGLHHEDGTDLDESVTLHQQQGQGTTEGLSSEMVVIQGVDAKEKGRREWLRDLRRRLWWCVYSFDRLVSTCVGRPFGITDQVITTDFPSMLDDEDITRSGFLVPAESFNGPSYKRVSHHYFRLRLLQSEILQVLQYRQAKAVHKSFNKPQNPYMHTRLSSSFLRPFESFHAWREDMDHRLWQWKESAPQQQDTTVQFPVQFLELNYWQAIIMLYRQDLSGPPAEAGRTDELGSPMSMGMTEDIEDEDVYLKIAEAGQKVLMLYRQLHRIHLVNYTYLATVHLFMAGIAFLYVLWHSPTVRGRLTLDDVDFTVLAATSVLGDLMVKCPPAEACRDAFERMSRATINLCLSTTGFASSSTAFKTQNHGRSQKAFPAPGAAWSQFGQQESPPPLPEIRMDFQTDIGDQTQNGGNEPAVGNYGRKQDAFQPVHTPQSRNHQSLDEIGMAEQRQSSSMSKEPLPPNEVTFSGPNDPFFTPYGIPASNDLDEFLADYDISGFDGQLGMNFGLSGNEHDWSNGVQLDLFDGFFFGGASNAGSVS